MNTKSANNKIREINLRDNEQLGQMREVNLKWHHKKMYQSFEMKHCRSEMICYSWQFVAC